MTKQICKNAMELDKFMGKTIESYKLESSCDGGYCRLNNRLTIKFGDGRKLKLEVPVIGGIGLELWIEEVQD